MKNYHLRIWALGLAVYLKIMGELLSFSESHLCGEDWQLVWYCPPQV